MLTTIPDHARAQWDGNRVINKGDLPLWSGEGAVPNVGDVVPVNRFLSARVDGYKVEGGWLMLICTRSDGKRGDLAGAEIAWKLAGAVVQTGDAIRVDTGHGFVPATFVRAYLSRKGDGETLYVAKVKGKERTFARINIAAAL